MGLSKLEFCGIENGTQQIPLVEKLEITLGLGRPCREAPYRWRHACLAPMREFLIKEVQGGRYHPQLSVGLYDD